MQIDDRFIARGNAVAFAGFIASDEGRQVNQNVPIANASCSLPVSGGASESMLRGFAFPASGTRAVSIESCRTRAWHEERGGTHITQTEAEIKGLQIGQRPRLFLESARAAMRSEHPQRVSIPSIEVLEPPSVDLRLDDHTLRATFSPELASKYRTKDELRNAYERDEEFHKRFRHCFFTCKDERDVGRHLPEFRGHIFLSLVEKTEWVGTPHPDVNAGKLKIDCHVVEWTGFGKIYLAEMLVSEVSRRFTLLRVQLGSPLVGSGSACEVETNGQRAP